MVTEAECYEMAAQCELQAATVKSPQARDLLLEVAAKWREMGDEINERQRSLRRSSPRH